jgi:hypothetical protein
LEFFNKTLGAPYSHRANFFSVIDTVEENYFAPISSEVVPFIIRYIQLIYPQLFEMVFKEALNQRLDISNFTEMH